MQPGLIDKVSFETLVFDPTLVLPVNAETTQKLIHVLATELRRLREDIAELQEAVKPVPPDLDEPMAVKGTVRATTRTYTSGFIDVPGIGTGSAYLAGDAFGTIFYVPVPVSGTITTACFLDRDAEGLEMDLALFTKVFVPTADNAAFAVSDTDLSSFLTTITFATFKDLGGLKTSTAANMGVDYVAPDGVLYAQFITRGAPNIAANNLPSVYLTIRPDN